MFESGERRVQCSSSNPDRWVVWTILGLIYASIFHWNCYYNPPPLLLLLSSSSSSSSSPLCTVLILIFLRQTMSLGNTLLQLFCCYYSWCLYRYLQCWIYCTFTLVLSEVCVAVFCSSLISWFPGMLLTYFLNDFEIVPVAPIITVITFYYYYNFLFSSCTILPFYFSISFYFISSLLSLFLFSFMFILFTLHFLYIPVVFLVYSSHFPSALQSIFHFMLLYHPFHYLACLFYFFHFLSFCLHFASFQVRCRSRIGIHFRQPLGIQKWPNLSVRSDVAPFIKKADKVIRSFVRRTSDVVTKESIDTVFAVKICMMCAASDIRSKVTEINSIRVTRCTACRPSSVRVSNLPSLLGRRFRDLMEIAPFLCWLQIYYFGLELISWLNFLFLISTSPFN